MFQDMYTIVCYWYISKVLLISCQISFQMPQLILVSHTTNFLDRDAIVLTDLDLIHNPPEYQLIL